MAKPRWGTFWEARACVFHTYVVHGFTVYVCECVFGLCALYVRVCTVYMCVIVCTRGVCPCVWYGAFVRTYLWHVYLCLCVVNTVCVCVCVVYVMSMFLCGEVCGGLCDGYGVCVICSVCLCCMVNLCMWRGVWYMCVGLRMCCVPLCVYMYVYLWCARLFLCVWCWVCMSMSLCVCVCVSMCVFTPAWGLQPHRSRSGALLSDLSIPARIQSLPVDPHMDCGLCLERAGKRFLWQVLTSLHSCRVPGCVICQLLQQRTGVCGYQPLRASGSHYHRHQGAWIHGRVFFL